MRSAARRTAAVLMIAMVAMLVVATGGSARAAQHRPSVSTGNANSSPHHARQVDLQAPAPQDQSSHLLDLASTPPAAGHSADDLAVTSAATDSPVPVDATSLTPTGRAPPGR